jgi:hypothetical protein
MNEDEALKKLVIDSSIEAIKVGYAEGRLFERERIIAILEDKLGYVDFEDLKALIRENGSVEAAKTVVQDGCGDCKGNCCERL